MALCTYLAGYERRRNAVEMPRYHYSLEHAALAAPTGELAALFTALAANPDQTRRFFGTYAGTVPIAEFFAPEARRLVFAEARRRGLWAVTAGPVGFSAAAVTRATDGT